jgi:hypothetical protein
MRMLGRNCKHYAVIGAGDKMKDNGEQNVWGWTVCGMFGVNLVCILY